MPQKRQAPRPDGVRDYTRLDPYPAAPEDPRERQEFFRRRNAHIAGQPEEEYLKALEEQEVRVSQRPPEPRPKGRQDR